MTKMVQLERFIFEILSHRRVNLVDQTVWIKWNVYFPLLAEED